MRARRILVASLICSLPASATAGPVVKNGLEAFIGFEEGTGSTSADATGNGHHAKLVGSASWGSGGVKLGGTGALVSIPSAKALRASSFTLELWFEARGSSLGERLFIQAGHIGGEGLDILEWYGRKPSFRLTKGAHAVLDPPSVGSITTPAPPDHMGQCAEAFHKNDGPEHLVFVHDAAAKRVKMFIGLENKPLRLCYDGHYKGNYSVDNDPLTLGNIADGSRPHPSNVYQLAYYGRVLTHTVGGNREVSGGELLTNHQAGPSATTGPTPPDAGPPPDAGVPSDLGAAPECELFRATSYAAALSPVKDGSPVTFSIPGLPASGLSKATLELTLEDADHPGKEGWISVNGKGQLQLPADSGWDDLTVQASVALPLSHLVGGKNELTFSYNTSPYWVGKVAIRAWGPACAPQPDLARPDLSPGLDAGVQRDGSSSNSDGPSSSGDGPAIGGDGAAGAGAQPDLDLQGACQLTGIDPTEGGGWPLALIALALALTRSRRSRALR